MKRYTTYEEPLKGRTFTEKQMKEVYRDMANKAEYDIRKRYKNMVNNNT